MLFINKTARLFTVRERMDKAVVKCDLIPGDNEITDGRKIEMLKSSFYFKELVKNKVMVIGEDKKKAGRPAKKKKD